MALIDYVDGFIDTPVRERRKWDDDILNNKRVRMILGEDRKKCFVREFNSGIGDWETFCRSVQCLLEMFGHAQSTVCLRDGIVECAKICISLNPRERGCRNALSSGFDISMITGMIYVPFLAAWCAVCYIKGASSYDCEALYSDDMAACRIIAMSFTSFDKLTDMCYTDKELFEEYKSSYKLMKGGNNEKDKEICCG